MIAALLAAMLVPPPPPPLAHLTGGQRLCHPRFAIRLAGNETADQHGTDWWVVNRGRFSVGIRVWPAADAAAVRAQIERDPRRTTVSVPGHGRVLRVRQYQWPDDGRHGWTYMLPEPTGGTTNYILISSFQFGGGPADHVMLQRVLTGEGRRRLCAGQ